MDDSAKTKSNCNECGGLRNSIILKDEKTSVMDESPGFDLTIWKDYQIIKCLGCDGISFREEYSDSEHQEEGSIYTYFPAKTFKSKPDWYKHLDRRSIFELAADEIGVYTHINQLLNEVYTCMSNSCPRAASMSIRALIESVMINKVGDLGSFEKNLNGLHDSGYISKSDIAIIEAVIDAGNATIHRVHKPDDESIKKMLLIVENLIESIYFYEGSAKEIKARTPQRQKTKKSPPPKP